MSVSFVYCTNICGQLFSGMVRELGDKQNSITVGLHGCSSNRAQPVVCCVVQLWKVVTCNNRTTEAQKFSRLEGVNEEELTA